jgi:hypothetical protein
VRVRVRVGVGVRVWARGPVRSPRVRSPVQGPVQEQEWVPAPAPTTVRTSVPKKRKSMMLQVRMQEL